MYISYWYVILRFWWSGNYKMFITSISIKKYYEFECVDKIIIARMEVINYECY